MIATLSTVWSCDSTTAPKIGPPAHVEIVDGQDQSGIVGTQLPVPLTVKVTDASGNPVPGQTVNFVVTSGGGSVFAGAEVTTSDGLAKERWTLGTSVATPQTVEARAVDQITGAAVVFGVFHATALPDAGILQVSRGSGQSFEGGAPASDSLAVLVADKYGNPIPNVTVVWTPAQGSGSVNPTSSKTAADGIAETFWTTGTTAGTQTVSAAAEGVSGSPVTFSGTATVSPASISIYDGNNQSATAGTRVPIPPSVIVKDARGNPCCAGQVVTFNAAAQQGSVVGDPNVQVDASGIARVGGWVLGADLGPMRLTATLNSLPSVTFSATALAPHMAFVVQPSNTVADDSIKPPVQVSLRDESGNGVYGKIFITLGNNPGNGTLRGTLSANLVNGIATFPDLSINAAGSGYTLLASSDYSGNVTATSAPFTVSVRTQDVWNLKAPIPEARSHFEVGAVNGILYAMGGMTGGTAISSGERPSYSIWAYDPGADTWSATGSSSPRVSDAIGVIGNVIYSTNGDALDAYTPATNSWASKAALPTTVYNPAAAVVNGILYVIGASSTTYSPAITQAYDPNTNTWATKSPPPMNFPQFTGRAAVVNGTLYFIDDSQFTGQLLAYDPGTDTWTSRAPMISSRKDFGFASLGGLLYAVGGVVPFDASQPHSSGKTAVVEVYDPATNSWKPVHPMSVRRNALAVTGFNGLLYGIGGDVGVGNTDNNATALNEAYAP